MKTLHYHLFFICLKVDKLWLPRASQIVPAPDPASSASGSEEIP